MEFLHSHLHWRNCIRLYHIDIQKKLVLDQASRYIHHLTGTGFQDHQVVLEEFLFHNMWLHNFYLLFGFHQCIRGKLYERSLTNHLWLYLKLWGHLLQPIGPLILQMESSNFLQINCMKLQRILGINLHRNNYHHRDNLVPQCECNYYDHCCDSRMNATKLEMKLGHFLCKTRVILYLRNARSIAIRIISKSKFLSRSHQQRFCKR